MAAATAATASSLLVARADEYMARVYGPPTGAIPLTVPAFSASGRPIPHARPLAPADLATSWRPRPLAHGHRGRYLWTDAFGILNFVSLALLKAPAPSPHLAQAAALAAAVDSVLGRTRDGTAPLPRGGLRIGKLDEAGAPDGDGQYLHYLTKMAHALASLSAASGCAAFAGRAAEIVRAAFPRFLTTSGGRTRTFWKALPDLSGPAPGGHAMGGLDAFGCVQSFAWVAAVSARLGCTPPPLEAERAQAGALADAVSRSRTGLVSMDALDAGDACWTAAWVSDPAARPPGAAAPPWAATLASEGTAVLVDMASMGWFGAPPSRRLAFREYGAVLGMAVSPAASHVQQWMATACPAIEAQWEGSWTSLTQRDADITPVMAAAAALARVPGSAWRPPSSGVGGGGGGGGEE